MLTDLEIKNKAKPKDTSWKMFDQRGLYLYITPGGSRIWRYAYRINGKARTFVIGDYDKDGITLSKARSAHDKAYEKVSQGIDPNEARRNEAAAKLPIAEIADQWLAMRWPDHHGPDAKPKADDEEKETNRQKGSTRARDETNVAAIKAAIGDVPVTEVTMRLLAERLLDPLQNRGQFETRVRMQGTLNGILGFAQGRGIIATNPLFGVTTAKAYTAPQHEPMHAIIDPKPFGQLLRDIDTYRGRGMAREALIFLSLTYVRPGHVQEADWDHFDLDAGVWTIPFEKLKQSTQRKNRNPRDREGHRVSLARQTVALLREAYKITGNGQFVFVGTRHAETISEGTMNAALESLGYKGIHSPHGFRSTASTLLNAQRIKINVVNPDGVKVEKRVRRFEEKIIEMTMDHKKQDVIQAIYDRGDCWDERVEIMQAWADMIDHYRAGTTPQELEATPNAAFVGAV